MSQLSIQPISKEEYVDFLSHDHMLQRFGMDYVTRQALENEEFSPKGPCTCLGYYIMHELAGVVSLEHFNSTTTIVHFYVGSDHWGTNTKDKMIKDVQDWNHLHTHYLCAVIYVPFCCKQVRKVVEKDGFILTGVLPCGIMWRKDKVENLAIMHKLLLKDK